LGASMLAAALSLSAAALAFVLPPMHSRLTPGAQQNRGIRMQHDSDAHCTVIFLRHGQSTWNEASLFTGWANVELTTLGKNEAARAATQLWSEGHKIDVAYTSLLKRAQQTLDIVLRITGQEDVPVHQSWRLNERMYGDLTGLNKKETAERFGAEQVKIWRRSYDTPPPPIDTTSQYWPGNDNEYAHIKEEDIPLSECLKDTVERTLPYWEKEIVPALKRGKTVLIAAHGNSIRGMLKALDDISDDAVVDLEIPTGVPLIYTLDANLQPIRHPEATAPLSGVFLGDAAEVARAQQQVAQQSIVAPEEGDDVQFLCIGSGCVMLSTDEMRAAFDAFDADGSGAISAVEFKSIYDRLAEGEGEEELSIEAAEKFVKMVDRDGDGQIDFAEFVQAMTAETTEGAAVVSLKQDT